MVVQHIKTQQKESHNFLDAFKSIFFNKTFANQIQEHIKYAIYRDQAKCIPEMWDGSIYVNQ